jgi:hypothetical protein
MNRLPVTVCANPNVDLVTMQNICPTLPCDPTGSGYNVATCDQYQNAGRCWNLNYCKCVCLPNCTRFAFYPYKCSRDFTAECDASKKSPPIDLCAASTSNPPNDICYVNVCNDTNHQQTTRPFIGMGAPCTMQKTSDSFNGQTEGYCSNMKCRPAAGKTNPQFDLIVTQISFDEKREGVPSRITVGVAPNSTRYPPETTTVTVTRVQALYWASIDSPTLPFSSQRTLELVQGGNAGASWWSAATPSADIRPARNVTIRVWATVGSTNLNASYVFSDWGAASNRNPQVEIFQPESATLSSFKVKVWPLDWVESATLRPCGAPSTSQSNGAAGTRVAGTSDVISFDVMSVSAPNGCARVDLVMADKINLQVAITLPCAFANDGANCKVSRMSIARKWSCSVDLVVSGNANYFQCNMYRASFEPVFVDNLTVISGTTSGCPPGQTRCNANMTKASWDPLYFSGSISSVTTPQTVAIKLRNGMFEYFRIPPPIATAQSATCLNGSLSVEIVEQVPATSGKCCNKKCLPLDPVTDAAPVCLTTSTTAAATATRPSTTQTARPSTIAVSPSTTAIGAFASATPLLSKILTIIMIIIFSMI